MNWQETVMSNKQIAELQAKYSEPSNESIGYERNIAKAQAKATWEARQPEVDEAEQKGVKRVVDFFKARLGITEGGLLSTNIDYVEWQAFLKGVEKPVKEGKDEQIQMDFTN